jgi:decaprenylphospho-beta-D-ribofuranose 2-oxidase
VSTPAASRQRAGAAPARGGTAPGVGSDGTAREPGDDGTAPAATQREEAQARGEASRGPPRPGPSDGVPTALTGWGRTAPTLAAMHRPADPAGVAELLRRSGARGALPRGLGRSYGDAAQNAGGEVISTTALRRVSAFDPDTGLITVGAGLSIGDLARLTLPHGWFPPVLPGTSHVTIGGAIAADVHGKNHHREGSFCDHVRSLELATPAGEILTTGPEEEPDAFAATAGGMGLTGIVVEATLQLLRVESDRVRVDTERARDLDDVLERMERGDEGYRYSVAWIDCLARGRALGRSVLMRGDHAGGGELPPGARSAPADFAPRRVLSAPPGVPSGLLSAPAVRAFNEAYYRRAPSYERGRLEPLHSYFHPLDGVGDWNRLYGPRGLLQYQLVVPFGAEDVLREVLERLAGERRPAFLGVLKRFGGGRGLLSFPIPGWTLAVDLPAGRADLAPFLDGLDELVAGAGGRLYLAKDARLRPELLERMYPELDRWRELRVRLDPDGALCSDLARRLGLVPAAPGQSNGRAASGRAGNRREARPARPDGDTP